MRANRASVFAIYIHDFRVDFAYVTNNVRVRTFGWTMENKIISSKNWLVKLHGRRMGESRAFDPFR